MILLSALLVAAIGATLWEGRARWNEAQALRRDVVDARIPHVAPPPAEPAARPEAPPAAKYVDVATNDLFSKDRNPTVIIEPPKLEKPKVMPPLPVVYGVLGLPSGVKALMAEKAGASSQSLHAGDSIGEFKIAALDPQNVTFIWEDKEIRKRIEDLMDRSAASGGNSSPAAGGAQPAGAIQINAPPPPPPANLTGSAALGVEVGAAGHSERACRPGDSSPAGTVIDGYKKVLTSTPFGQICRWEPAQ